MTSFTLEIATPERLLIREQVSEAQIPARQGELGVRPEHAPLIAELGTGVLTYLADGRRREMVVCGGVVEVLPDRTRVLADVAVIGGARRRDDGEIERHQASFFAFAIASSIVPTM